MKDKHELRRLSAFPGCPGFAFFANRILRCLLPVILITLFPEGQNEARAQAPATAENFLLTDITGVEHELYSYLDEGYAVLLIAGAAWSAASWELNQSGVMTALYEAHGPAGQPGVAEETTDDIMVIFAEADLDTDEAALFGSGPFTQGDWTEGADYPLINLSSTAVLAGYGISGFPAGRLICPDRIIRPVFTGFDAQSVTAESIYAEAVDCPSVFGAVNPALVAYTGETAQTCADGTIEISAVVQNLGTALLQNFEITVSEGNSTLLTDTWSGSLATYEFEEIFLGSVQVSGGQNIVIEVTSEDEQPSNGWSAPFIEAIGVSGTTAEVHFYTDFYPAESIWMITDQAGATVASGGPYQQGSADPDGGGGPDANAVMVHEVTFPEGEACYNITVTDTEGDGLLYGGNPAGIFGIEIFDEGNSVIRIELEDFGASYFREGAFRVGPLLNVSETKHVERLRLRPNPARREVHIAPGTHLDGPLQVRIFDLAGKTVASEQQISGSSASTDLSSLSPGLYIVAVTDARGHSSSAKLVVID